MDTSTPVQPHDEFNSQLLANVHPPDWVNPKPTGWYNLVVIGAGTAGLVAAAGAAGLGAKVALIERHLMGGDCLNYGCVPSKALIRAARACAAVRNAHTFGIKVAGQVEVDFAGVMERLRRLRAGISRHDSAHRFRELGVDVFLGEAHFTSPNTIAVDSQTLQVRKAVIATGARAAIPEIPGLEEAGYLTNESVFSLTELPRRLAVIGGGPIGCELAQAFARFGSQVTLLQQAPQILPREDRDAAAVVEAALQRDGVDLRLAAQLEQVMVGPTGKRLIFGQQDKRELEVDEILIAAGRQPNVEGLGLGYAEVDVDPHIGVIVDDFLRTTNRCIFAAGDVCSPFKFTHAADFQARIVIQNALFLGRSRCSRLIMPWCTYTTPEIAHVGMNEAEAAQRGYRVTTLMQPLDGVDRAVLDGDEAGFVKIHLQAGTDRILGATIVAAHAGELISEISVAIVGRLGLKSIGRTIHPYPTQAEAIRKLGDAYNRTRLTPAVRWLLAKWLAWGQ